MAKDFDISRLTVCNYRMVSISILKPTAMLASALTLCLACSAPEQKQSGSTGTSATRATTAEALPPRSATAQSVAETIKAAVSPVTELIEITEENDPNKLIGRPNGYLAATVLKDSRLPPCTDLGVDCGATIEQWPDQPAAQKRADYIQSMRKAMPMLGQEWNTVKGGLLLRVTGTLKPSEAKAYEAAFTR